MRINLPTTLDWTEEYDLSRGRTGEPPVGEEKSVVVGLRDRPLTQCRSWALWVK